ncbi:MAG TPA: hypothetical protein VM056_05865 [Terriglobales bacterium]|nr:hypothetical protein [Terriglobales bacterium]
MQLESVSRVPHVGQYSMAFSGGAFSAFTSTVFFGSVPFAIVGTLAQL